MTIYNCLSLMAGLSCGVAVGMLVAPQSGVGLRKEIAGKMEDGRNAIEEAANETLDEARYAVKRRVAVVDHAIKGGVAAFKDASEEYLHS